MTYNKFSVETNLILGVLIIVCTYSLGSKIIHTLGVVFS